MLSMYRSKMDFPSSYSINFNSSVLHFHVSVFFIFFSGESIANDGSSVAGIETQENRRKESYSMMAYELNYQARNLSYPLKSHLRLDENICFFISSYIFHSLFELISFCVKVISNSIFLCFHHIFSSYSRVKKLDYVCLLSASCFPSHLATFRAPISY